MSETALDIQKLLSDAIRKQMSILGPQITLLKAHNTSGITLSADGSVTAITGNSSEVATHFLEQFREISAPLVKKTMKPLLSAVSPSTSEAAQTHPTQEHSEHSEHQKVS